ncbi:hypothetical protein [Nostoc piscinale]|uniref:hypothetical protein n=1 Tax=Nostoc piscinale TaxID=224012 RepID=UPI000A7D719B|nr:hypothetical protein [Nostoc piscinale]
MSSLSSLGDWKSHASEGVVKAAQRTGSATQTKPICMGLKTLDFLLVRIDGLCLYSRDF